MQKRRECAATDRTGSRAILTETTLIATVAVGLTSAFVFGFIAVRLGLPPLVGYLLAGVVVGPFTPGFVADAKLAPQLADIGVILLMFGVGTHVTVRSLWAVRGVALPGALAQIAASTAMGVALTSFWGWSVGTGVVFGLALAVASTVVSLRALEARKLLDSENGRVVVGWLVVEDLVMVVAMVVLPALAGALGGHSLDGTVESASPGDLAVTVGLTLGKVALFIAVMLVIGVRFFPWLIGQVERTNSRELFTLACVALALGVAFGSAQLFGVSYALGAFIAGVVVNESDLSHRAARDLRPLQDAFAALFFVAVGMLFNPMFLVEHPIEVLAVVAIIVVGNSLVAALIVLALRRPIGMALCVSAAVAQIGEFSFILGSLGVSLGLLTSDGFSLIVAGALLSITLNPLMFRVMSRSRDA